MLRRAGLMAVFCLGSVGLTASAVDQVIFKDGFSIIGRRFTEQEVIRDSANGTSVKLPRARGFDIIENGPKWYIFSNRTQQVGKILENVKGEADLKEYKLDFLVTGTTPLPAGGLVKIGEFNDRWVRIVRVDMPATKSFAEIQQKLHSITPARVVMPSANYMYYPFYDTKEVDPAMVKKYILTHPDRKYDPAKPDAAILLDVVQFFKDTGWLDGAAKELEEAKKTVPGAWPKEVTERSEKLAAEIAKARSARLVTDYEKATRSGMYDTAKDILKQVDDSQLDAVSARVLSTMRAQVETVVPRFEKAKKLLRNTIDAMNGSTVGSVRGGLLGSAAMIGPSLPLNHRQLRDAGEQILAELHPDSVDRLDFFISLGDQAQRKIVAGQDPGVTPENLLALAITGWLKGKNGAEQNVEMANRFWRWRTMLLAYQAEPILNKRRTLLQNAQTHDGALTADEIAQLIGFLPPSQPEDLTNRSGTPAGSGLFRRNTGHLPETARGVDYVLRLPKEYHHGKPARLMIVLTHNTATPEQVVELLGAEADRHGYILAAPYWVDSLDPAYNYKGDQHYKALATLRSVRKHFRVDDDRVFVFGYGEGANFAMDVGASHPDQFAGVVAMGANPKNFNMFMHYWRNFQKLPLYLTIGSIAADSFQNTRLLFQDMMPKGYNSLGVVYRGRGMEWFYPEVPVMFDWMEPKKRLTGTATLRINEPVEPWMTMRTGDNRFYWIGSDEIKSGNLLETWGKKSFLPAEITADIKQGNAISVRSRGVNNVVIWFDRTLINWNLPVSVTVNGDTPNGWKAKKLQPDIDFMLEQFYQFGDRSLLFLNKLEVKVRT